jgi:hypothetical protein
MSPRRDIRCLAACTGACHGGLVVACHERTVELHDHVEQEVAESRDPHE